MRSEQQTFGDGFGDLFVDLVDGEVAGDEDDAVGFAGGDFAVLLPDAAVEGVLLLLEAVFVLAGLGFVAGVAAAGAGQAGVEGGQQQESEVGLKIAANQAVQVENYSRTELAAAALVGFGRVGEAVAEDHFSGVESGLDDFGDGLGAVAEHERHFGHGGEAGGAGVEKNFADAVAGRGSAGLAGDDGLEAALLKPEGQALDLGGLAGTVKAFERDE